MFLVCHEAHLLRVLLSGKPGAVQWGQSASNLIPATRSVEALLAFYDFPAEHWDHLRTANPIESVFATVRHRTIRTKGSRSQKTVKLMVFKLVQAASKASSSPTVSTRTTLPKPTPPDQAASPISDHSSRLPNATILPGFKIPGVCDTIMLKFPGYSRC